MTPTERKLVRFIDFLNTKSRESTQEFNQLDRQVKSLIDSGQYSVRDHSELVSRMQTIAGRCGILSEIVTELRNMNLIIEL